MKRILWMAGVIVVVMGCTEKRERELPIREAKVISESEPNTRPPRELFKGILYTSTAHIGGTRIPYVDVYTTYRGGPQYENRINEVADTNRSTAWISQSDHVRESLWMRIYYLIDLETKRGDGLPWAIDILPGWAKDEETFKMYSRPRRVRLELYNVPRHHASSMEDRSYIFEDKIRLVYSSVVELTDEMAWQRIPINMKDRGFVTEITSGRLVIEDVYPGISNVTAISEIRFRYMDPSRTNRKR